MILFILSILLKIGRAPFHYWLPLIIEGLEWINILILLTWQKINPIIILFYNNKINFLYIFIFLSLIIGAIKRFNNSSLKKIISYSSINQLRWIIISLNNNYLIKLYLLIYFYLIILIIRIIKLINLKYLSEIYNLKINNIFIKLFFFSNFLSLGGLPPFLGFFPKILIIIKINNSLIIFLLVTFTLLLLFIYFRIILVIFLLNSIKINNLIDNFKKKKINKLIKFSLLNNLILLIIFFIF